jgi:hypothetical protein
MSMCLNPDCCGRFERTFSSRSFHHSFGSAIGHQFVQQGKGDKGRPNDRDDYDLLEELQVSNKEGGWAAINGQFHLVPMVNVIRLGPLRKPKASINADDFPIEHDIVN